MTIKELNSVFRVSRGIEAAIAGTAVLRTMENLNVTLRPLVALGESIEQMRRAGAIASCAALTE